MNAKLQPEENKNAVEITDFAEYGAVLREILHATWFISDTSRVLDSAEHQEDTSPFYPVQLRQLIRAATGKQMSLIERLEEPTTVRPNLSDEALAVLDLPPYPEKISKAKSRA